MQVTKRNGTKEEINYKKIEEVLKKALEGTKDTSISDVLVKSKITFYNGITTQEIQNAVINSAAELISLESPDYQYVAGRLLLNDITKRMRLNIKHPESLLDVIVYNTHNQNYDEAFILHYSEEDINYLNSKIDYNRDEHLTYASMKQFQTKYLIADSELPQQVYMLIAMWLFANEHRSIRISKVLEFYEALSTQKISLPSPILVSCRTKNTQFSSCALIEVADSLDSICEASRATVKYISNKAGLGINVGAIRSLGDTVGNGRAYHTGIIPFLKLFESSVKSCSQGGFRGGSATVFYPFWHYEAEDLLVLKNNKGTEENRVRKLDYAIQLNQLFYDRVINNEYITLLSPYECKDLLDCFYSDPLTFTQKYEEYETTATKKKSIKALDFFGALIKERAETGRIYIQNIDHCNSNTSYNVNNNPVKQSNLCMEITLPTEPLYPNSGEMALCTLGAFNLGKINNLEELEPLAKILVQALNNLLDMQDYPIEQAEVSTKKIRSLGVGVTNFAYYLAKNNMTYKNAPEFTTETFEAIQYYLVKASIELAKETGVSVAKDVCQYDKKIRHIKNKAHQLKLDWDKLLDEYNKYGILNSSLTAVMPCESSSIVTNSTNGIEPIKDLITAKVAKNGVIKLVAPEANKLKDNYEYTKSITNLDYLHLVCKMQVFVDHSISANTYYNPNEYPDKQVSMQDIAEDILFANAMGLKTLYYHNTYDGSQDVDNLDECESCKL